MLNLDEIRLMQETPLATVSVIKGDGITSSPMPLFISECGKYLLGHISNNNPLVKGLNDKTCYVQFLGANGYISPRWHEEQRVPTWNYVYSQLKVEAKVINDWDEKMTLMSITSAHFDKHWSFEAFINEDETLAAQMMNAITVIRFEIIDCQSKFKLSQKRSREYHQAISRELKKESNLGLANLMTDS